MTSSFKDIERLESDLWEAADNLRANSKLTSSDYFMPVLGVIFLRHATNRFDAAHRQIAADQASGKMPKRKVLPADYIARRSLYLPEKARYDWIMQQAALGGADLPKLVVIAYLRAHPANRPTTLKGLENHIPSMVGGTMTKEAVKALMAKLVSDGTFTVADKQIEYKLPKGGK